MVGFGLPIIKAIVYRVERMVDCSGIEVAIHEMSAIVHELETWSMLSSRFFRSVLIALFSTTVGYSVDAAEVEGTVLPFKSVIVSSPVQEIIAQVPVDEGDTVKRGDVLAQLRSEQEILELTRYDQLIDQAEREYETAKRLAASGSGTASDRDERETELKRLQSERALVKLFEAGESVDRVEDIFEVIDIDTVFIRVYVDDSAFKWLKQGENIAVKFPKVSEDELFQATVDFVDSRIDPASGLVRVKLLMSNPGHRIKAGMRARVQLPVAG